MALTGHEKALDALEKLGLDVEIITMSGSTATSADAARELGVSVAEIGKSIIFKTKIGEEPVICILSGADRLDKKKLRAALGGLNVRSVGADYVFEHTGYQAGGVSPVGHSPDAHLFFDQRLLSFDTIYVAAGDDFHNFGINPKVLADAIGARIVDIREGE